MELRRFAAITLFCLAATGVSAPASAQQLDVPFAGPKGGGQAGDCATSFVAGLNPRGDNFLAVRAGPGSNYRKLDELHSGDVVATCARRGAWHGVLYDGRNVRKGMRARHRLRRGWVHGNWLRDLAG
jgi:uncharacterized protein YgiM (DUF1202 family)